jgi:hypothetical protein
MIICCDNCGINWARLHSQAQDDDEIEYCPLCKTDMFLSAANSLDAFCMCQITGKIFHSETGEVLVVARELPPLPPVKQVYSGPWFNYKEHEALEEAAIDAYTATGDSQLYFDTFKRKQ